MLRLRVFVFIACICPSVVSAGDAVVIYTLTSDCIDKLEAREASYSNFWDLEVTLRLPQSEDIEAVTSKNLGKRFSISGAEGNLIGVTVTLRAPLSSRFIMSGFKSEEAAQAAATQLMKYGGKCGLSPNHAAQPDAA